VFGTGLHFDANPAPHIHTLTHTYTPHPLEVKAMKKGSGHSVWSVLTRVPHPHSAPLSLSLVGMQDVKKNKQALWTAVYVGMVQNILSKAIKYALFDPTKEMAYIPLDQESKVKGKAAIDVLAARIGKSGGALIQQMIVLVMGNIINGASVVAAIFFATIAVWIYGVIGLAAMFEEKIKEGKAADKAKGKAKA